jgi:hypothetical protein
MGELGLLLREAVDALEGARAQERRRTMVLGRVAISAGLEAARGPGALVVELPQF